MFQMTFLIYSPSLRCTYVPFHHQYPIDKIFFIYFHVNSCWINKRWVLIGGFLIPLALCVLANLILFLVISVHLHKAAHMRRGKDSAGLQSTSFGREMRAVVSIFTLLGLSWLFGGLIDTGNGSANLVFQYLFAIFTTLQGFVIFLLQCVFNDRVLDAIKPMISTSAVSAKTAETYPGTMPKKGTTTSTEKPGSNVSLERVRIETGMSVVGDHSVESGDHRNTSRPQFLLTSLDTEGSKLEDKCDALDLSVFSMENGEQRSESATAQLNSLLETDISAAQYISEGKSIFEPEEMCQHEKLSVNLGNMSIVDDSNVVMMDYEEGMNSKGLMSI